MSRRWIAWGLAGLNVGVFLVTSLHPSDGGLFGTVLYVVGIASFSGVGALLWTRVPDNPIGPLLLGAGTLLVASIAIGTYADVGASQAPPWPGADVARHLGDTSFIYPFVVALIGVPLVFPDGRLPSPRFRWVVAILVGFMAAWTFNGLVFDPATGARIQALSFLEPLVGILEYFVLGATLICFGAAVYAVWRRFRHGNAVERQQVKWLAADVGLAGLVLPLALLTTDANPGLANALSSIAVLAMFALPVVIGIAILRYRLYEIDRIISRAIGYLVVTGILATVFVAAILVLTALLSPLVGENPVAVAAATLLVAALFQPVRGRVQHVVDRRFNRARYDADRTATLFAAGLRDETDLGAIRAGFLDAVARSLEPADVGLWVRDGR
jgi:hypothetical protein